MLSISQFKKQRTSCSVLCFLFIQNTFVIVLIYFKIPCPLLLLLESSQLLLSQILITKRGISVPKIYYEIHLININIFCLDHYLDCRNQSDLRYIHSDFAGGNCCSQAGTAGCSDSDSHCRIHHCYSSADSSGSGHTLPADFAGYTAYMDLAADSGIRLHICDFAWAGLSGRCCSRCYGYLLPYYYPRL